MSKEILIKIRDKIADRISGEYVCGNSDFVAVFDFDEEWIAYETKTARFYYGDEFIDQPFSGDRCEIPILSDIHSFEIGVFAGNLKTSTSAYVPARKSILCKGGSPAAPSPDVYAEIMEMLNNSKLPPEEIAAAVKKYLDENGIDPAVSKKYVDDAVSKVEKKIPKKTSELENDAGFLTEKDLPSGGGSCLDLEDFELIDTIDFSTEEMAQRGASKSYTVDNVLEVVVVWKCLRNISSSTNSFLPFRLNTAGMGTGIKTIPSNSSSYGYCYYKVLKNLGAIYWNSPGASSKTNYEGCSASIPYNLNPLSQPITSIYISNATNADWIVTSGTVEIYVR